MELRVVACDRCGSMVAAGQWTLHSSFHGAQGEACLPLRKQFVLDAGTRSIDPEVFTSPPPQKPKWTTVFSAGIEGGDIDIEHNAATRRFRAVKSAEHYPDEDASSLGSVQEAATFEEALAHFGKYAWHRFTPIQLDPRFLDALRSAWLQRIREEPYPEPQRRTERWETFFREVRSRSSRRHGPLAGPDDRTAP